MVSFIPYEERDPWSRRYHKLIRQDAHRVTDAMSLSARHAYYGMVSYIDHKVGLLLEALEKTGALDNAVIVFTADQLATDDRPPALADHCDGHSLGALLHGSDPARRPRGCTRLQIQLRENLFDHRLREDRRHDPQRAAAVRAMRPVELEHALE